MTQDIVTALKWRYATKKFDSAQKISEAKLNILKESFNLTATSYGLQPLKLLVISDPKIKESLVPPTMNQVQVKDCSHVLVLCTETEISKNHIESYFKNVEKIRRTPSEILKPFEIFLIDSFSEKPKEEIQIWAAKQAYLAMGNLLTVCAIEEIDACPIEGFDPAAYDSLLELNKIGLQSVLVLAVGYRAEDDMFSAMKKVRRGVKNVVIEM
ncbi:NAD(P)H-dependent oxidoreductase [Patiriisocius marinistellae]|uniref:NAD(P)H-dependent oxidoreductase n=1 Tax=Patiriisocius marinistellae TaxID=2494560 RepID=A0A5J4G0R6_9FLAO|nr:NAD(P)H-dependent oxidoreductase [Patiriisocius marinistellae]GEQ86119.1 NAD(P)H-dependent oxidoreductase [Patiriisocius marinistellae]